MVRRSIVFGKGGRRWQGIPGIERAANGLLRVVCYTGGDGEGPGNYVVASRSADAGSTWSEPAEVLRFPKPATRAFDPTLWHDPDGLLWLIVNRGDETEPNLSVWAMTTTESSQADPAWTEPFELPLGVSWAFRMNKPIVTTGGRWVLPVTWDDHYKEGLGPENKHGVALSDDGGRSWRVRGRLWAPEWSLENMIVERRDGSLWMLIRTGGGYLWESVSGDGGETWSEATATAIPSPGSRFFIGRLRSGNLLLINHPTNKGRVGMMASISADEGKTWSRRVLLDDREKVSYPDAVQAPDGTVYAVYDRDRNGDGEIILAVFDEKDFA